LLSFRCCYSSHLTRSLFKSFFIYFFFVSITWSHGSTRFSFLYFLMLLLKKMRLNCLETSADKVETRVEWRVFQHFFVLSFSCSSFISRCSAFYTKWKWNKNVYFLVFLISFFRHVYPDANRKVLTVLTRFSRISFSVF
jgi:hypothetical protein